MHLSPGLFNLLFVAFVHGTTWVIDDADPAFGYHSTGGSWNAIANNRPCDLCTPFDASSIHDGTWHDTIVTGNSASVAFRGVSGTMFGICPQGATATQITSLVYAYNVNGVDQVQVTHALCKPTQYQFPIFSVKNLDNSANTTITVGNGVNSILLIDYFQYDDGLGPASASSSSPASTSSASRAGGGGGFTGTSSPLQTSGSSSGTIFITKSMPVAAIAAPLGAIIFLLLLAIAFLFLRRNRRANPTPRSAEIVPAEKQEMHPAYAQARSFQSEDYTPPTVASPMIHPDEPFDPYRETSPRPATSEIAKEGIQSRTISPENTNAESPSFPNSGLGRVDHPGLSTSPVQTMPPSYEKLKSSGQGDL